MNGTKEIAIRMVNAENAFINNIIEAFGFSEEEAITIFYRYRKDKIIKLQLGAGRYNLTHGMFWDREIMEVALSQAQTA